jgi:aryl-alcohol dehydrogenase-like predicted oxidoreductase
LAPTSAGRLGDEKALKILIAREAKGWPSLITSATWGVSNFSSWRLMQALWASDKHGFESFVSIQPEYSLVAPVRAAFERELAPVCLTYGLGVLPYSPLAGGFLTGKYRRGQPLSESVRTQDKCAPDDRSKYLIVETLVGVAQRLGLTPARVGLA